MRPEPIRSLVREGVRSPLREMGGKWTLTLTASRTTVKQNNTVSFVATLSPPVLPSWVTGQVVFLIDGAVCGSGNLVNGTVTVVSDLHTNAPNGQRNDAPPGVHGVQATLTNHFFATNPPIFSNTISVTVYTIAIAVSPQDTSSLFVYAHGNVTYTATVFAGNPQVRNSTQRATTSNVATITSISHGYGSGQVVTTTGFGVAAYNVTNVAITVIDVHHFTYPITHANEADTFDSGGVITPVKPQIIGSIAFSDDLIALGTVALASGLANLVVTGQSPYLRTVTAQLTTFDMGTASMFVNVVLDIQIDSASVSQFNIYAAFMGNSTTFTGLLRYVGGGGFYEPQTVHPEYGLSIVAVYRGPALDFGISDSFGIDVITFSGDTPGPGSSPIGAYSVGHFPAGFLPTNPSGWPAPSTIIATWA